MTSSAPVYTGSCHCGAVRFEVAGPIEGVELCNCSICTRTAYLHWYVEPSRFRLISTWDAISTYEFGTRVAKHHFCRTCGISPFRRARSNPHDVDVNLRCVEGVDVEALPLKRFDGRNWEMAIQKR